LDQLHGEVLCELCGLVEDEQTLAVSFDGGEADGASCGRFYAGRGDHLIPSRRMGSCMLRTSRDGKGRPIAEDRKRYLRKLNRLDRSSVIKSSTERNLNLALQELGKMGQALNLPKHVRDTSALFYSFAVNQRLTVGRNVDDFLVAALYCACLRSNYPMTLAEMGSSLEESGWESRLHRKAGKAVKLLKRALHIKLAPPSPKMLISRFCSRLQLGREIEDTTQKLLSEIQSKGLLDGRPGGIAAAAIYIATHICGEKVSQKHLAEVAGVTDMTVRHQYKIISKELNINVNV